MTNIDDSTQTPPGHWFGVIEGRLHERMRDTLADLGLRRGSWRILHTLADGPASADELAEHLPHGDARRGGAGHHHDHHDHDRRQGSGHGEDRGYGRASGRGFHPGWRGQEPRDERAAAPEGGHPHPDGDAHSRPETHDHSPEGHRPGHGDGHPHGGHGDGFEQAFERGYARGFDRGFAFGAVRGAGPFAGGPFGGGQGYGAFPGRPFPGGHGYGPFPGGRGYGPYGAGRPAHPCDDRHHPGAERGGRRGHRIQRVLADFVERGWVWFDGDRATLTDEGREAHDHAFERVQSVRAELTDGIVEGDYAVTMATLERMARNLGWRPADHGEAAPDSAPSMDA